MQIHTKEIIKNFYLLRIDDNETRYFEALWNIPEGITYNSYLLVTDEGAILFDTWKKNYSKFFIETLRKIIDLTDIKYLVIHHMEPDHSGSINTLLEQKNDLTIIGHPLTKSMLEAFYNISPNFKPINDEEKLKIGNESIKFIHTPWLHWPETIMSFLEKEKILISCDAFGGFSIPNSIYDDEADLTSYMKFVRKYFTTIIGHYTSFVIKNIEKIKKLGFKIKIIAPSHGLIFRSHPDTIVNYYYSLASGLEKDKIVIIYDSMYGFIEKAIANIIDIVESRGIPFSVHKFTDTIQSDLSEILSDIMDSKIIILGVSTYENDLFPIMKYLLNLMVEKISFRKKILIISSYGWGKIISKRIPEIFQKKYDIVKVLEFKGVPKEKDFMELKKVLSEMLV